MGLEVGLEAVAAARQAEDLAMGGVAAVQVAMG